MIAWLVFFSLIYIILLIIAVTVARKSNGNKKSLPHLGTFLGFMTYSATLFSTFTLMGLPNFFKVHGIGAWIFLGITDTAMAFVVIMLGYHLNKLKIKDNYINVSSIIRSSYNSDFAKWIYIIGIFIFLMPYVAIQIRGVSKFLSLALPGFLDFWIWALLILGAILVYSYLGGFKAIVYSDAIQGSILLVTTIMIAIVCVVELGGFSNIFNNLKINNPELLSIPGPKMLFTPQFLLTSFVVINLMPITQPQLFSRIVLIKNVKTLKKMSIGIGIFAFLVILPTIFIGFYGAIKYSEFGEFEFLQKTLVQDQVGFIAAIAIIGLVAAAMSTADSQLFAIEKEFENTTNSSKKVKHSIQGINLKLPILFFGLMAFILALISSQELALLALKSFSGTAILAPMIVLGMFSKKKLGKFIPTITAIFLFYYLLSLIFNNIPSQFFSIGFDLISVILLSLITLFYYFNLKVGN